MHLLLVPKVPMDSALCIDSEDFLEAYMMYLEEILGMLGRLFPLLTFRHGVHARPSLHQMHCHVLSQEFVPSDGRDRLAKGHWQSFQEPFLVPLWMIRKVLFSCGEGRLDASELQAFLEASAVQKGEITQFVCPRCGAVDGLEEAFGHLTRCTAALPLTWPTRVPE